MRCLITCFLVCAALVVNADDQKSKPSLQDLIGKPVRITMKPSNVYIEDGPLAPGMVAFEGRHVIYTCILVSFTGEVLNIAPLPSEPKSFKTPGLILSFDYGFGTTPEKVKVDELSYMSEMGISRKEVESIQPHQDK